MSNPIQAIAAAAQITALDTSATPTPAAPITGADFGRMLSQGVERVNAELLQAEATTRAFALGGDIPIHQVTYAIEHARLSFELLSQVRTRLVEGYQELLRMQI